MAVSVLSHTPLRSTMVRSTRALPAAVTIPANSIAIMMLQIAGVTTPTGFQPASFAGNSWTSLPRTMDPDMNMYYWYMQPGVGITAVPDWVWPGSGDSGATGSMLVLDGAASPGAGLGTGTKHVLVTGSGRTTSTTFTPQFTGSLLIGQFFISNVNLTSATKGFSTVTSPAVVAPENLWDTWAGGGSPAWGGGSFAMSGNTTAASSISVGLSDASSGFTANYSFSIDLLEIKAGVSPPPLFTGWGLPV